MAQALYNDDKHVEQIRSFYDVNFQLSEKILNSKKIQAKKNSKIIVFMGAIDIIPGVPAERQLIRQMIKILRQMF